MTNTRESLIDEVRDELNSYELSLGEIADFVLKKLSEERSRVLEEAIQIVKKSRTLNEGLGKGHSENTARTQAMVDLTNSLKGN